MYVCMSVCACVYVCLQLDSFQLKVTIPTAFTLFRFLDVMQVRDVYMYVCVCVCVFLQQEGKIIEKVSISFKSAGYINACVHICGCMYM